MADEERRDPAALLPLTPTVFHILLALADGEKHGYAIMQEVEARTDGAMRLGPGTLYGSIQRMLKDRLIVEVRNRAGATHGDERRRYYRLTGFGQQVLQAEAQRLEDLVHMARSKQILPGFGMAGGVS
ncbi:MAG TPA: PadR family transcriptional regulator [Ktedonobacterales bacterium]